VERPFFHSGDALNQHSRDSKTCTASTNYDHAQYCIVITKGGEGCLINGKKKQGVALEDKLKMTAEESLKLPLQTEQAVEAPSA